MSRMLVYAAVLVAAMPVAAQHDGHTQGGAPKRIGTVVFANSGAPAAQEPFLRGVALLHSYEYLDARDAFHDAETADPGFALAYWLDAFTYSQFDWGIEDLPAAQAALARLAPARDARLAKAGTAHERTFGAGIESFLEGRATLLERARAFSAAMQAWSAEAPGEVEGVAFSARAALYVLLYAPPAERVQRAEDAITLAQRVVDAAPAHPGGLHYLIHAADSPRFATRGLDAAHAYDALAPDADHALHMPSHIYLQLGMWPEVSSSNARAWAASQAWVARGGHSVGQLGWHSLQWLQYGLLQEGRYREARDLIETARKLLAAAPAAPATGYPDVRYAIETMEFQYAAETGDWTRTKGTVADTRAYAERALAAPSLREQQRALTAAYHVVAAMAARRDAGAGDAAGTVRSTYAALPSSDPRRTLADRLAAQLDALAAGARGDRSGAIDQLTRLVGDARDPGVTPVGPPPVRPPAEMLGAALAADGRFKEAIQAYERALEERPNRSAALLGLARARVAAGDKVQAADTYAQLRSNWEHADPTPALAETRRRADRIPNP